jgi:protein TonB
LFPKPRAIAAFYFLRSTFWRVSGWCLFRQQKFLPEGAMFSGLAAVEEHHGKRWTAVASFAMQGILVSAALILPLLYPAELSEAFARHRIFVPVTFGDTHVRPNQDIMQHGGALHLSPIIVQRAFTFPTGQNRTTSNTDTDAPNPQIGIGEPRGEINSVLTDNYAQPVLHPTESAKPRPVSVVMEGNLIHRVEPPYPPIAKQIRLKGTVVVQAFVSPDGTIERAQIVSGPAVLAQAALNAVKQWRYRPYYLNGTPIEVETQVTVKFTLNQ